MTIHTQNLSGRWMALGLLLASGGIGFMQVAPAWAAKTSVEDMANFTQFPVVGTSATVAPQVVLNVSRDHQLFYKAYNDYTDLDGDGTLDTTYEHQIDYYGYFDSYKCYNYDTGDNRFEPASVSGTKYCSGNWSGNFLNWATMTRMDATRKLLIGGLRSTDTSSLTVLERAHLPGDSHSFAKFYGGSDIAQLTPFNPPLTSSPVNVSTTADIRIGPFSTDTTTTPGWNIAPWNAAPHNAFYSFPLAGVTTYQIGDQIRIDVPSLSDTYMVGGVTAVNSPNTVTIRVDPDSIVFNGAKAIPTDPVYRAARADDFRLTNLSRTGISFCNTTYNVTNLSQADTTPPLLRVAQGNYELWGANEQVQCKWFEERNNTQGSFYAAFRSNGNRALLSGLNASGENPRRVAAAPYAASGLGSGSRPGEFIMRVEACNSSLLGNERCKRYPNGNHKPIGLLQQYGDEGDLTFAMFTPTWDKNVSGGVLRKAKSDMRNEVNVTTDGTFKVFAGIVQTLNKMRIYNYNGACGDNYGGCPPSPNDGCTYQRTGIGNGLTDAVAEGNCSSWGNPMSELYAESLRYLAHGTPTATFAPGTKDATLGMPGVGLNAIAWADPVEAQRYCSPLNVLNFNASVSSYDWNNVPTGALAGSPNPVTLTTSLGNEEGLSGSVFIGENGTLDDNLCSIKTLAGLGAARGLCPEAPALEGSYGMAGLAWWARTNKIRTDLTVPGTDRQSLRVTTYGIQLATNTPKIEIPIPGGRKVNILPAYRLDKSSAGTGPFGGGAIVDFRVVSLDTVNGKGKFYINWEDSAQGGDYDQDMWGTIDYEILNGGAQVKITTDAVSASTNRGQGFGYIISGTSKDGPHFHSGIYAFDYTDATSPQVRVNGLLANGGTFINASGGCTNCTLTDPPTSVTYDVTGVAAAQLLRDPLWYAAKYGGFTDTNNNNKPDLQSEWDTRSADGTPTPDGVPDTYFLVTNPGALEDSLSRVFQAILSKTSSGTAAAVVANSSRGFGAIFQALFEARRSDSNAREARWLGDLQGIWVDSAGLLREDLNGDKTLGNYTVDPAIQFYFDTNAQPPRARYKRLTNTSGNPNEFVPGAIGGDGLPAGTTLELEDLKTLWNARKTLAALSSIGLGTQRTYGSPAEGGRHLVTWVDANRDKVLAQAEIKPFAWGAGGIDASNMSFLNSDNSTEAKNIVDWTRGLEVPGLRNRLLDYTNSGSTQVQRFGDIVNSTPAAVGSPAEAFNLLYRDSSYTAFARGYTPRRQIVYAGANDGILHAFHSGFFDPRTLRFAKSYQSTTAHQLGSELWGYIPSNLLAHLRWLSDPNYSHVFYVDGSPYVFDANVFTPDSTHINGWGTLLAVNFRTGGGTITVDTQLDGLGAANADNNPSDDYQTRAATVLLDVTDPEGAPKVLAEIPVDEGWQLGRPTVAAFRKTDGTLNKFFMVVPSGPNKELGGRVVSDRAFKIRVYDLATLVGGTVTPVRTIDGPSGGSADLSFASDPASVDFDLNYKAEAIYFGTVKAPASGVEFTGSLFKINTGELATPGTWTIQLVHDTQRPITVRPTASLDDKRERYVYVGTGRLLSSLDADSVGIQRIYGIKDRSLSPNTPAALPATGLVDVTNVTVTAGGLVNGTTRFEDYLNSVNTNGGWYRNLDAASVLGGSERVVSNQAIFSGLLLTTTYVPSRDLCANLGTSKLFVLNYKAGVASPSMANVGSGTPNPATVVNPVIALGAGVPSAPTITTGQGQNNVRSSRACTQTSTGAIICQDLESEQLTRSSEVSWRQPSN